jgi:hypothetical protein
MRAPVKPQSTEWLDPKDGPPFVEFTFHYRSLGLQFELTLMIERLREMGILPETSLLDVKAERSEFSNSKNSGSSRRSFWSFWGK